MADESIPEVPMEVVDAIQVEESDNGCVKRAREESDASEQNEEKRIKVEDEKSVEEKRIESSADGEEKIQEQTAVNEEEGKVSDQVTDGPKTVESSADGEEKIQEQMAVKEEEGKVSGQVAIGPKTFESSVDMFDYFYKILHTWTPNLNLNKYEHLALLDLIRKGHLEPERKIGVGVRSFQVRYHPQFKSRCFFLIREDESADDFSFRKCVDHILPLPENMQIKHDVNKALRGKGGGRGRGRGRGRGGR